MAHQENALANGFKIIGMLVPLIWFGGMATYFIWFNNMSGGFFTKELGPTIMGLSVIVILLAIKPLMMLVRSIARGVSAPPVAQRSVAAAGSTRAAVPNEDGAEPHFDADDAIARYLARRETGGGGADAAGGDNDQSMPVRPSFGRKLT